MAGHRTGQIMEVCVIICNMSNQLQPFTPFIPSDDVIQHSGLADKALALTMEASKLAGKINLITRKTIVEHMRVINSYYSNLIEGNNTHPSAIRAAQRGDFSSEPAKRDLQEESLAHIRVQDWIMAEGVDADVICSPDFILALHRQFYQDLPPSLLAIKDKEGNVVDTLVAGVFRERDVEVGQHHAPDYQDVPTLMSDFCEIYHPDKRAGDRKLIAAMAAHHRFVWIHPFIDGNGRVGRLLTDTLLRSIGLESEGVWCLSRGLAKRIAKYKSVLATADSVRQGDLDGRGALSQSALVSFIDFMLDTALDQVKYMEGLLQLDKMKERITAYVQARNDQRVEGVDQIKEVAAQVLYHAFMEGSLSRSQALALTGMPGKSAQRLIAQLRQEGLLTETSHVSDLTWAIPEHAEKFYFPQLTPEI